MEMATKSDYFVVKNQRLVTGPKVNLLRNSISHMIAEKWLGNTPEFWKSEA
jgi:hypothetical protein